MARRAERVVEGQHHIPSVSSVLSLPSTHRVARTSVAERQATGWRTRQMQAWRRSSLPINGIVRTRRNRVSRATNRTASNPCHFPVNNNHNPVRHLGRSHHE